MKQTLVFAKSLGTVACTLPGGQVVVLPIVPGILKHPRPEELPDLLRRPGVAVRYTRAALRQAAWPVLRLFPREWLRQCLPAAGLRPGRAQALTFLLSTSHSAWLYQAAPPPTARNQARTRHAEHMEHGTRRAVPQWTDGSR